MSQQQISSMMSGLSLGPGSPNSKPHFGPSTSANPGNRLPPLMKKYMNPQLVRPANTGLSLHQSTYGGSSREPLLKLAGVNVAPSIGQQHASTSKGQGHHGSPATHLVQHTAHGLHGPAHSTASRVMSASTQSHLVPSGSIRQAGIGRYDGGLEADEASREAVTGEAAKILELDSSVQA